MRIKEGLISIIVPVYNAAPFLKETLQSIIEQTYTNWELILVDDASTDGSPEVLKAWIQSQTCKMITKKIKLILKYKNEGPAAARNCGIRRSEGRYLVFLDADDFWDKQKLEKQYRFMSGHGYAFTFTGYEFVTKTGTRTAKQVLVPEKLTYKKALGNTTISTITVMLDRKQIPEKLLIMPNDCKREDTATWWRILKHGFEAYGLNEILSFYRRYPGSHSSNKLKAVAGTWQMYRKQEKLPAGITLYYFILNLVRAVKRRIRQNH